MPTTYRETILVAALAKLSAITGIAGLVVARNRVEAVDSFPTIALRDGGHRVDNDAMGFDLAVISFDVELYVRAPSSATNPGTILNELYGAVKSALQADRTLGGVAHDTNETGMTAPDFDASDAYSTVASAVVSFDVEAIKPRDNPF
jgi:hypothetical protein